MGGKKKMEHATNQLHVEPGFTNPFSSGLI